MLTLVLLIMYMVCVYTYVTNWLYCYIDYTFIPDNISTKKCLLDSAESCYNWAMKFGMYDHDEKDLFKTLIGSVFVKVTTGFMKEVYGKS